MNLKILSWNVLCNKFSTTDSFPLVEKEYLNFEYRLKLIIKSLKESNSDIILLQEIDEYKKFENDFQEDYNIKYYENKNQYGILILIKKDLKFESNYQFFNAGKIFVHIILYLKDLKINIITTHLKARKEFFKVREQQMIEMENYIKNNKLENIIITGDFNCDYNKEIYINKFISNLNLENTFKGITTFKYHEKNNKKIGQIDYIFYNLNIKCTYEVNNNYDLEGLDNTGLPSKNHPSDHLPIICNFNLFLS